jgi:hypothetical protein
VESECTPEGEEREEEEALEHGSCAWVSLRRSFGTLILQIVTRQVNTERLGILFPWFRQSIDEVKSAERTREWPPRGQRCLTGCTWHADEVAVDLARFTRSFVTYRLR